MILIDTSAFIALCDKGEGDDHFRSVNALRDLRDSKRKMVTLLPCITEAMYYLHKKIGWSGQKALWQLLRSDEIDFYHPKDNDLIRTFQLMEKYKDIPMDFADASLVAAAEKLGTNRIFTLDSDFYIYRINGRKHFEIIP